MPKKINLINQRFGKLLVLSKEKTSPHGYYWLCQCDCGKKVSILGANLRNGNTKSCGCLRKSKNNKQNLFKQKDISNKTFGKWTVLYPTTNKTSSGSYYWHCRCCCGTEKDVEIGSLISNKSKSCGCIKSFGEEKIATILEKNNIKFQKEYTFKDCKTENDFLCRFDFAIFKNNKLYCLIEYDGKQHFEDGFFDLEKNKQRDKIKNSYCLFYNIPLYRIPYTDLNNIITFSDIVNKKYLVVQKIENSK